MPIKIPDNLPAYETLLNENIFVMAEGRAKSQDIRPLKLAILNLMPTKITTETQLLRMIGNTPLQVDVTFLQPATHQSKNTDISHLDTFYNTWEDVKDDYFDGLIITGAPIEQLDFESVDYWDELVRIMNWSKKHVYSTFHICWGAQAGLYYHYGIQKYPLKEKMFGIFKHRLEEKHIPLFRGYDDEFYVPHSRHTEVRAEDVLANPKLTLMSHSKESGVYIVTALEGRHIFVMGHSEYDGETLNEEYTRDINSGLSIDVPQNYFPNDDPTQMPLVTWRGHGNLLYFNWLNYYVYQDTPYNLEQFLEMEI